MRYASRSPHPEQYSDEVVLGLTWSDQAVRPRMLPGKTDIRNNCASQPQLPARGRDQPGPAIGCLGMARPNSGPAQCLFEEPERVLDGEATQVPAPENCQLIRQRTTNPGQPQRLRRQLHIGQPLDLHADDGERCIWRTAHVETGPDIDLDRAVEWVFQLGRLLRPTVCARVG